VTRKLVEVAREGVVDLETLRERTFSGNCAIVVSLAVRFRACGCPTVRAPSVGTQRIKSGLSSIPFCFAPESGHLSALFGREDLYLSYLKNRRALPSWRNFLR
jgi:hypothetical protein